MNNKNISIYIEVFANLSKCVKKSGTNSWRAGHFLPNCCQNAAIRDNSDLRRAPSVQIIAL